MTGDAWQVGGLVAQAALDHPDLLAAPVLEALRAWDRADEVGVVEIDPGLADTAALTEAYDLPDEANGNCVVVGGRREGRERVAACVVRADTRADVNNLVKRRLDVRKASFLGADDAVERSAMEYGGITPVGLPEQWRIFVDESLTVMPTVVLGSGLRRSKLLVPGALLAALPHAEVVEHLGR